jgi:hypothetical protein
MSVDLTAFSTFTSMRRADIYKFVGNDPRTVKSIEELQNLLSGNVPDAFSSILGTSIIAGDGLTGGGTLSADVTLNVGAGTGLTVSADAIGIANTTVTAGTYGDATHVAQVTFNAQGQATAASSVALHLPNTVTFNSSGTGAASGTTFDGSGAITISYNTIGAQAAGSYLTGNQTITLSGDATGSGSTAITVTLAASGVTAGTYTNATVTVDAKGRVTAASNGSAGTGGASTPTIVQSAILVSSSATGTVTFGAAPAAGHMLIAIGTRWASSVSTNSGWTLLFNQGSVADDIGSIWYKSVGAGESATQAWSSTTMGWAMAVYEVSNVAPSTFLSYFAQGSIGSSSSLSANLGVPKSGSLGLGLFMAQLRTNPTLTISGATAGLSGSDTNTANGGPRTATACSSSSLSVGAWQPSCSYSSSGTNGYAVMILGGV